MQQSNFIFGALAVAFVVFITTRGSLPTYMSVLFGTAAAPPEPSTKVDGKTPTEFSGPVDILTKGLKKSAQADAQKIIGDTMGFFFGGGN